MCLCTPDNQPDCNQTSEVVSVYRPGANFNVAAVVVGQRNGVVPGVVLANLEDSDDVTLSKIIELQSSSVSC